MKDVFTVIISFAGVCLLIFATYYGLKWMNKRTNFGSGGMLKVIEKINIGADKALMIIAIGEKYILVGVSQQHVEKVCELDSDSINTLIEEKNAHIKEPFAAQFLKAAAARKGKKGGENNDAG